MSDLRRTAAGGSKKPPGVAGELVGY